MKFFYKLRPFLAFIFLIAGFAAAGMDTALSQSMPYGGNQQISGGREDLLKNFQSLQSNKGGQTDPSIINTRPGKRENQGEGKDILPGEWGGQPFRFLQEEPLSQIEEVYNKRLEGDEKNDNSLESASEEKTDQYGMPKPDKKLRQFGYDFFKREITENFLPVGEGYKVGPGDTVSLYFWGDPVDILGLNGFYTITVDRDGKIFVPNLGVFYVWGLDIVNIKEIIHSSLAKKFKRFEIALTLGQLRQFPVYVSGYVNKPGVVLSLGTYSVIDVLVQSGGIAKNGSLRDIVLIRKGEGGRKRIKIDLYDLFIKGELADLHVKEGDSLLINKIGRTAAATGDVKRPAIYEVSENESVKDLIEYAGGLAYSAYMANAKQYRYENDKVRIYEGILSDSGFLLKKLSDGDCLSVQGVNRTLQNDVTVEGYIKYPGKYEWSEGAKLSDLINRAGFLPDTDRGIADIKRKDSGEALSFSPKGILSGGEDIELQRRDIITFYPRWLNDPMHISGEVEEAKIIPYYAGIKLLDAMKQIKFKKEPSLLKAEIYSSKKINEIKAEDRSAALKKQQNADVDPLKKDIPAELYQSRKTVYLHDLLVRGNTESDILLEPGDKILIRTVEGNEKNKTITLLGEVKKPGVYRYRTGMKLSDIIEEAGGYTNTAYPSGLIFTRRSAQQLQMNQINLTMISMEEYVAQSGAGLGAAGGGDEEKMIMAMVAKQQSSMLSLIRKKSTMALGRLALDIPPTMEKLKKSDDNIVLVEDDYIFIPAKPNYVLVLGNVYNQISMPHSEGKSVGEYLKDVGGPAKSSDLNNIYVIKANGKIISRDSYEYQHGFILSFFYNFENLELGEGDAVVVPFEVEIPIMWRPMIRDITQIIFQSISTLVLAQSLL